MAYSVREERQSLATSLREELGEAERMIVQVRRDTAESFLLLLDRIEERFVQLESSGLDLRPEQTRWASLQSKMQHEARRLMRILDAAGGLEQMRQAHPPAQDLWWHLDAVVAEARRRLIRRLSITFSTIIGLLAIVWVLLTFVFPPDPNTVVASEAISTLQQMAFEGRWEEALAVIEDAKAQLTQPDAELLIWEGVISDKLGQYDRSQDALAAAKDLVPSGQLVSYWWTLGSVWLSVGDLDNARNAADEALALDASDPQGYFLMGSVFEAEGNTPCAIDLFDKTFELAADGNPQLAVIARVRMGNLLQRPANLSLFAGEETENGDESTAADNGAPADPCAREQS